MSEYNVSLPSIDVVVVYVCLPSVDVVVVVGGKTHPSKELFSCVLDE